MFIFPNMTTIDGINVKKIHFIIDVVKYNDVLIQRIGASFVLFVGSN